MRGLLRTLGKIATPDSILLKPGPLTATERSVIELHTVVGYDLLCDSATELLDAAAVIALSHHERWDGAGYPHQLRGDEIPLEARIAAVADVFDSLLRDRPCDAEEGADRVGVGPPDQHVRTAERHALNTSSGSSAETSG